MRDKTDANDIPTVSRARRFQYLRSLPSFKEAHRKLLDDGLPVKAVATWLQQERGEAHDVSLDDLCQMLRNYRSSRPAAERAKAVAPSAVSAAKELARGMDELEELQHLYRMQMERIQIDFNTEKQIKKLLPTMTQEIRVARELLAESAKLKMDLGIKERHLGTVDVETTLLTDVAEKYADSESVKKVLQSGDSRRKVLGLAERLLAIADRAERHPEMAEQLEALTSFPEEDASDVASDAVTPPSESEPCS